MGKYSGATLWPVSRREDVGRIALKLKGMATDPYRDVH